MTPFSYARPAGRAEALQAAAAPAAAWLGGGTSLLDLMKLGVRHPTQLIDIAATRPDAGTKAAAPPEQPGVAETSEGLRIDALARMAHVAGNPSVCAHYPALRDSLVLAASPQIRNMARMGGNLLQGTRCPYWRDTSFAACNRRTPGSGCTALDGENRGHAVLGGSDSCIATYPGDLAQALIAFDATLELRHTTGTRTLPLAQLHCRPGTTPHIEHTLAPGELIEAINVPAGPWTRRSLYLKVRDRASYCFALASAAIAMHLDGTRLHTVRIALGGLATVPWRAHAAEAELQGRDFTPALAARAAEAAFADAHAQHDNHFKIALGKQTLIRALMTAASMDIAPP